mgnify:CR=1 FL=1
MSLVNIKNLFAVGILIRIILLIYGVIQDSISIIKYTDVDYYVFLDSFQYLWNEEGGSPYQRDTFRYTPLLSYLMLPTQLNIHLGKVLFVIFDLLTAFYIYKLLKKYYNKNNDSLVLVGTAIWLLNPMVITISTRGNAESIMSFLIMLFLYLLDNEDFILSGIVYGLSIHFKIYPIIYCIPISVYFLFVADRKNYKNIISLLKFGSSSIVSLFCITYLVYLKFGNEFLEHTYFYHLVRSDHRHNFSIWNMVLYMEQMPSLIEKNLKQVFIENSEKSSFKLNYKIILDNKKLSTLPQMLICSIIPTVILIKTNKNNNKENKDKNKKDENENKTPSFITLIQVITIQTMLFVHFNKVITSQYFVWYLTFVPFFIQHFAFLYNHCKIKLIVLPLVWIISQAIWLYFGYLLEFKNQNCFVGLFFAGCLMFLGNVYVIGELITAIK